jgi:hypothetical protein
VIGFVSAISRSPAHPVNMKANNRAMIRIRAIPFCQVSKQGIRREGSPEMAAGNTPRRRTLCIGVHQTEKAADIFALRPPGKKLNGYEIHQPRCSRE